MKIKAHIGQDQNGNIKLTITPTIKEQNRLNSNAFTEHNLVLYSEQEQREDRTVQGGRGQAMLLGQQQFLAVLHAMADSLKLSDAQLRRRIKITDLVGL